MPRARTLHGSDASIRGHLVIPHDIRRRHGWGPGTMLEIEDVGGAVVVRTAIDAPRTTTLADLAGCVRYRGPARYLEQMDDAIVSGALGRRPARR